MTVFINLSRGRALAVLIVCFLLFTVFGCMRSLEMFEPVGYACKLPLIVPCHYFSWKGFGKIE